MEAQQYHIYQEYITCSNLGLNNISAVAYNRPSKIVQYTSKTGTLFVAVAVVQCTLCFNLKTKLYFLDFHQMQIAPVEVDGTSYAHK